MDNENTAMNENLADSIAMLEQILEVMPQDLTTLRALFNGYCQCNRLDKAFEYLDMIADICCSNNDAETAEFIVEHLPIFDEEYSTEAAALHARIKSIVPTDTASVDTSGTQEQGSKKGDADIAEELALAWKLYEENQLSQEEYSSVLHDLTEVSSKEVNVPVSVLHVLNDRGFAQLNRIMNYLSTRSGVPCISLHNFELSDDVAKVLPLEVASRDGALPFAFFGKDLLIAVLNPFNNALVDEVEKSLGHRCHTYLVSAEDYDKTLEKLRALAA